MQADPRRDRLLSFGRDWLPLIGLSALVVIVMMTWISCVPHPEHDAPGRYQMLLDRDGQVIVLDTTTGETWIRTQHSKRALP